MKTIPLTQGKIAVVDDEFYDEINKHKWCVVQGFSGNFSAVRQVYVGNKNYRLHMARVALDLSGAVGVGLVAHHWSHDTLDNRLENLIYATRADHNRNRKNNTSGYAGVHWSKKESKFKVLVWTKGKNYYIGAYDDPHVAALARIEWMETHNIDTTFTMNQLRNLKRV